MNSLSVTKDEKTNTQRYLGLDILKVLSTLLIIVHHLSKHGKFFIYTDGITKAVLIVANALFLPSVNIFVFVSSYLIIKKGKATIRNLLKIYFEVVFYSLLTYFISCILSINTLSFSTIILCFTPISNPIFWFAQSYLIMYIISPLLLKIVTGLNKREYQITIVVIAVILTLPIFNPNFSLLPFGNGFSAIWFALLFILAGYQERFGFNFKKIYFLLIYLLSTAILSYQLYKDGLIVNYSSILVLLQTISLFNLLYNIQSQNKFLNNTIKYSATCTLGIYLLHDGYFVNPYIYTNILKTHLYFENSAVLLYFALFVIVIFVAGIIVETIRKSTLKVLMLLTKKMTQPPITQAE